MSIKPCRHVLLTGQPGIGKTTLIKKVCDTLGQDHININGFYTEEVRNESNRRNGFDVVTLDGKRERLSRTLEYLNPGDPKRCKVGQYFVFPNKFEELALPLFAEICGGVLVLDEIGKMELFSSKFQTSVQNAFKRSDISILATVPVLRGAQIPLVESLITDTKNNVITVNYNNRDNLASEIIMYLKK